MEDVLFIKKGNGNSHKHLWDTRCVYMVDCPSRRALPPRRLCESGIG